MSHLLDKCIWTDLKNDEQINQVIKDFDLSSMKEEGSRVNFDDDNCKIKKCSGLNINEETTDLINGKPIHLLSCDPIYDSHKKIKKLLLKKDQRDFLTQHNPFSTTFSTTNKSSMSPTTVSEAISPIPFKAGKKIKKIDLLKNIKIKNINLKNIKKTNINLLKNIIRFYTLVYL